MKSLAYSAILVGCILSVFSCAPGNKSDSTNVQTGVADSTVATPVLQSEPFVPADSSFASFITLFEHPETNLPEWAVSFLTTENVGHITTKDLLEKTETIYAVLYDRFVPAGPGINQLHIASFTKDGSLISDIEVGSSYPSSGPDGGGKDYKYEGYDVERHVLSISNSSTDWNEGKQEDVITEMSSYFLVGTDGELFNGRKYSTISSQLVDAANLAGYSNEELKIMRNEIFASYGYIFKTEPMKSHYAAMPWYRPSMDNVDMLLNDVEKANIKTIKEAEEQ